ncbi:hypothetical protein M9Y10_018159 [Tritrichomonas musculus]|uniref:Ion transport domain-containing protein n=1 Tax=Tritrichomonas musculus TaxID=1915356 RepID=A0ABR2HN62_9EUKA
MTNIPVIHGYDIQEFKTSNIFKIISNSNIFKNLMIVLLFAEMIFTIIMLDYKAENHRTSNALKQIHIFFTFAFLVEFIINFLGRSSKYFTKAKNYVDFMALIFSLISIYYESFANLQNPNIQRKQVTLYNRNHYHFENRKVITSIKYRKNNRTAFTRRKKKIMKSPIVTFFNFLSKKMLLICTPRNSPFNIFDVLQSIRIIRLFYLNKYLKSEFKSFIKVTVSAFPIIFIFAIITLLFAFIGNYIYGKSTPSLFGNIFTSIFTVFGVSTMDAWTDVTRKINKGFVKRQSKAEFEKIGIVTDEYLSMKNGQNLPVLKYDNFFVEKYVHGGLNTVRIYQMNFSKINKKEENKPANDDDGGSISNKVKNETTDKSVNDKSVNDKSVNDKSVNDKSVNDKSMNDKSVNDKSMNDKSVNDKSVNDKSVNDKSMNDKSVNDKSVNDKSVNDKSVNDKSVNDKSVNDKSMNDKSVNDKSVNDKSVNDDKPIKNDKPVNFSDTSTNGCNKSVNNGSNLIKMQIENNKKYKSKMIIHNRQEISAAKKRADSSYSVWFTVSIVTVLSTILSAFVISTVTDTFTSGTEALERKEKRKAIHKVMKLLKKYKHQYYLPYAIDRSKIESNPENSLSNDRFNEMIRILTYLKKSKDSLHAFIADNKIYTVNKKKMQMSYSYNYSLEFYGHDYYEFDEDDELEREISKRRRLIEELEIMMQYYLELAQNAFADEVLKRKKYKRERSNSINDDLVQTMPSISNDMDIYSPRNCKDGASENIKLDDSGILNINKDENESSNRISLINSEVTHSGKLNNNSEAGSNLLKTEANKAEELHANDNEASDSGLLNHDANKSEHNDDVSSSGVIHTNDNETNNSNVSSSLVINTNDNETNNSNVSSSVVINTEVISANDDDADDSGVQNSKKDFSEDEKGVISGNIKLAEVSSNEYNASEISLDKSNSCLNPKLSESTVNKSDTSKESPRLFNSQEICEIEDISVNEYGDYSSSCLESDEPIQSSNEEFECFGAAATVKESDVDNFLQPPSSMKTVIFNEQFIKSMKTVLKHLIDDMERCIELQSAIIARLSELSKK